MELEMEPLPDDDHPAVYLQAIYEYLQTRLSPIVPAVTTFNNNAPYQMRYLKNELFIWYVPGEAFDEGYRRPLAEEPCPKDKWYTETDLMAFSHPTITDQQMRNLPN
jgi:hypothetical protein